MGNTKIEFNLIIDRLQDLGKKLEEDKAVFTNSTLASFKEFTNDNVKVVFRHYKNRVYYAEFYVMKNSIEKIKINNLDFFNGEGGISEKSLKDLKLIADFIDCDMETLRIFVEIMIKDEFIMDILKTNNIEYVMF